MCVGVYVFLNRKINTECNLMYVVFVECVMLRLCWFICLGKTCCLYGNENCVCVQCTVLCLNVFVRYRFIYIRIYFSKVMHLVGWISDFSKLGYAFDDGHARKWEVQKETEYNRNHSHPQFMPDCCFCKTSFNNLTT